ncbi:cell division protein DivIB [Lysinibacillus yapensis]|uniref:Cell division protein DivIB n=1 Tax=Ureibacillus yapensis TaxID=2304605 RepID=A0A396SEN4_9BACL|nr:FtsQ-type POTRA domain-containing protein [Lysinibacillus yapensis]RHW39735.1 cell division protein DivIB [Lysinibacillus yapensis]
MDKVIDIEERIPTLREKRRKRTNFKFIFLLLIFLITLFLLLYFQSPYSKISKVEVNGADLVGAEAYEKQSGLQTGDSIWGFKANDIEDTIGKDYWIKDVQVKRKWLTTVQIEVDEWETVAYLSLDQKLYPLLANGDVFKESSKLKPIDAPLFLNFEDEKVRRRLLKELGKLDKNVLSMISQINSTPSNSNPFSITLFMNDGYEVRAEVTSLADKLNYYPSIVAQIENDGTNQKGIIDIEVGSYYKSYEDEYAPFSNDSNKEESGEGEEEVITDEEATSP